MTISHKNLDGIFRALDRQIEFQEGFSIGLLVCGGTALAALGLIDRTTKDVDVIAGGGSCPFRTAFFR
jgi:hypothetical protein